MPKMAAPGGESAVFQLQLNCTSRKSTENKTLTLSNFPSSTLELKKAIEREFSIPVCVQSVSYQLDGLSDNDNLSEKRIRSGDTLSISYLCEGDCKILGEIMEWLRQIVAAIHSNEVDGPSRTDGLFWRGTQAGYHELLPIQLFDWLCPKAYVNKLYFEAEGGLKTLIGLYRELANSEWATMRPILKYLESFSLQSIGNFGENFPLRRITLKQGVLNLVLTSLLRKTLKQGEPIEGFGETGDHQYEGLIWKELLTDAVYTISNFSELPECQLQIASRASVLEQVLCISMSKQCPCSTSVVVAEIFVCLAHSTATHQYLSRSNIVEGLLDVYRMRCEQDKGQLSDKEKRTFIALRCFTLVLFAQIALTSPDLLPSKFIHMVLDNMNKFLSETQPEVIKTYEQEQDCLWATLLPYIKLFYVAESSQNSQDKPFCEEMEELRRTSEKMILFFLHSKMSRKYCLVILIKEGLVDYVTALPWHVSVKSRLLAETVVSELSYHMKLQPPSLCSIVQAKLARMHFGLERVVTCDSPVDLIRSIQCHVFHQTIQ